MSSGETGAPQVAWIAIDEGAVVVAADGSEVGKVKEVAGDQEHDIFDGLAVSHSRFGADRYVASERVKAIWPDRIETDRLQEHQRARHADYAGDVRCAAVVAVGGRTFVGAATSNVPNSRRAPATDL